ncbi:MAG: Uma2 family endonuclease [Tepidisphaeraceae bacterium]
MTVSNKLLTWREFAAIRDEPNRHELIRGELVTLPPPHTNHGYYGQNISGPLHAHVRKHKLGVVFLSETGFLIEEDPDTVRAPDVSFLLAERWPAGGVEGYFRGAPDFVVEVLSDTDVVFEVEAKMDGWLNAGTQLAWLVNPRRKTVTVYRPNLVPSLVTQGQTLDAGTVVAGFTLPLDDIFA